jgi:hypothetical protein
LYEVNLIDPLTFAGVALLLISAIALASFVPARGLFGSIRLQRCGRNRDDIEGR